MPLPTQTWDFLKSMITDTWEAYPVASIINAFGRDDWSQPQGSHTDLQVTNVKDSSHEKYQISRNK